MKDDLKEGCLSFSVLYIKKRLSIAVSKNTWRAKIIRTFTSVLPVSNKRQGNCKNCGACCRLPTPCAFLKISKDGSSFCCVYKFRPPNCRVYPRTDGEFLTRDTCGHKFDK